MRQPRAYLAIALLVIALLISATALAQKPGGILQMLDFAADSGGSRPRIRDDVAQDSDLMSLGVPR